MSAIEPTEDQLRKFKILPHGGPVAMLKLPTFKPNTKKII